MPRPETRTNAGIGSRVVAPRDDSLNSPSQRVPQQVHASSVAGTINNNMTTNLETLQRASSVRGRVGKDALHTAAPKNLGKSFRAAANDSRDAQNVQ